MFPHNYCAPNARLPKHQRILKLHGRSSRVGTKFFVVASPKTLGLDHLLHTIYDLYSDYALKNPFYEASVHISVMRTISHDHEVQEKNVY